MAPASEIGKTYGQEDRLGPFCLLRLANIIRKVTALTQILPRGLLFTLFALTFDSHCSFGAAETITPGAVWPDDRGLHIQAHGGCVMASSGTFYWFGEDRSPNLDPDKRYISCYASKDLANWTFRRRVLALGDPEHQNSTLIVERPKVYFNARTSTYVMYFHADGPVPGKEGDYNLARVGVATCATIDGDYTFLRTFRPLGHESRDIGAFVDEDGSAYLIFEDRPYGFRIARLSEDYLSIKEEVCLVKAHLEAGAIVHQGSLYYFIGSQLSGWAPNPNKYAVSQRVEGPWSEFRDIAPPATKTYGAQSGCLLKIVGTRATTVIFIGDIWKPNELSDSRYLWMPLKIGNGLLALPAPHPWRIDVKTGISYTEP